MFGDYMNPDAEPDERVYQEVMSINEFYTVAEQCLEEYNNTHKSRMNLVIFRLDFCFVLPGNNTRSYLFMTEQNAEPYRGNWH